MYWITFSTLHFLMISVAFSVLSSSYAIAEISLVDESGSTFGSFDTSTNVFLSPGESDNFEFAVCGLGYGFATFNDPIPPSWAELFTNECNGNICSVGLWTRVTNSQEPPDNLFSWSSSSLFLCNIFRYSGVDLDTPIIDYECAQGSGFSATPPSVITETNSAVMQIFIFLSAPNESFSGDLGTAEAVQSGDQDFSYLVYVNSQPAAGQSIPQTMNFQTQVAQPWLTCSVSFRMASALQISSVPTMNEAGFVILTLLLMGISAVYLSRHKKFYRPH